MSDASDNTEPPSLKFVPAPAVELRTDPHGYMKTMPDSRFKLPASCTRHEPILCEADRTVMCFVCGKRLDAFDELLRYAKSFEKARQTLKAARQFEAEREEWYAERRMHSRNKEDMRYQRWHERMRNAGVEITQHDGGGWSYKYPDDWAGLRRAEAKLKAKRSRKSAAPADPTHPKETP